jgi:SAM-dependent methyltransferase
MNSFLCRSCGSTRGRLVLDLGLQPLANNLLTEADLAKPEPKFPLRLALCEGCWLLQITDIVPPVELFSEYLYFSSFSDALLRHAAAAVAKHRHDCALGAGSFVVEIASNDGYLLKNFVSAGIPCLGVEPAENIAKVAIERGVPTISRFFGREAAAELVQQGRPADLILGNNVFAHAPDTNDFVAGLATLLKPGGRIALEFPYACDLIEHVEFDTIYHEHVFYFTLTALLPLFARHGLEVFDVERLPIHGGSLRLYAAHRGAQAVRPAVTALAEEERAKGVASPRYYDNFGDRVRRIRHDLVTLVHRLKAEGRSIAAYGASAKGSTLLNYYGLGRETLDFVADRSTAKQGRLTPGTHLAIVAAEELALRRPDYALLLTWNFAEEILKQQQAYRDAGGRFIVPLPEVRTV